MAKISLRSYNRVIENLIENGQHDEAIAQCRHVLQTYSRYIEAYRLLGKSYLEAKRYNEAVDIFQRVLTAVPDDFVSHVGLSIIADDQGKLDDAIWHMERAFEVQPSNAAIQGELQRLFGRRDGMEPPKIRLTRGALAHMYVQGELYNQAVSEIRAVLSNDPQRIDMQVLLAKAYYFMGQKADATDACNQLLKRYPYCLDANRILAEILSGTQNPQSAQAYRQRVIELDPYSAFVQDSLFRSDQAADGEVSLEQLEYKGQPVEAGANWGTNLGIALPTDATLAASSTAQPEWLKKAATPAPAPAPAPANEPAPTPASEEPIPDFLRQAGWGESTGAFQDAQPVAEEAEAGPAIQADLPDWVKAMAPATAETAAEIAASAVASPAADVPDWLQNLDKVQPAAQTSPVASSDASSSSGDVPDWLQNLERNQPVPPSQPAQTPGNFPDWLHNPEQSQPTSSAPQAQAAVNQPLRASSTTTGPAVPPKQTPEVPSRPAVQQSAVAPPSPVNPPPVAANAADPLGGLGKSSQEQDDAMAWLESLAAKHGAKAEELVTDPNARTDIAPDWVDKAKSMGEAPVSPPAQPPSDELGQSDVWFHQLESTEAGGFSTAKEEQESFAGAESSDWLTGLSDQSTFSQLTNEPAESSEENPVSETHESPDWLIQMQNESKQPAPQDVPDWLHGVEESVQQAEQLAGPPPTTPGATAPLDLPAWLAGLDNEESAAPTPAPAESDLPSWLASEREASQQPPAPTQPEEWRPVEAAPQRVEGIEPADWSVSAAPPASVKPPTREISFEVEQPRPVKRPSPKPQQKSAKPARKPEVDTSSLENAQVEMGRGNIGAAIEVYARLIRKGKSLEEIIRDLRDALYRYPVEVPLWQALGDAYMRSNRLQEALDAYTKAEELLR